MAQKKVDDKGEIQNTTMTDLDVLKRIEKRFYENNPNAAKRNTRKSIEWFRKYITRAWNHARTSQMFRDRKLWRQRVAPGKMYFFEYDAKHKDTLPVWDRFPLIFPWDSWTGGGQNWGESGVTYFIGINLHYLPPQLRMVAMVELLRLRTEKRYRRHTKLQMSWEKLNGMSNSRLFEHAVKIYRRDHVKSVFVEIPSPSWEMVAFLPTARWQKGGKAEAWRIKSKK